MPFNQKDDFEAKLGLNTSGFDSELAKLEKKTKQQMESVTAVTNTAAVAFVGLAGSIALTTAEFAKYNKGLIAVQKTSNLSDIETEKLGDDLLALSKKAPLAVGSLLEIAEAAGQLGIVGRLNILKFTDTVAKLEATTNLRGEEAAKTLARILNVTGENITNVDKLGSAFVQLGNTVAASELEIATITSEVAKSTAIFNIGAANAVGLGASMAELGINAERGGTVVGRAFQEIKGAIDGGGESLQKLSKATGIAAEDLKGAFAEDATGVFVKFLASVKDVVASGGNATQFLDDFGLKGAGVSKVLAPLSLRVKNLTKNLEASNKEFIKATALEEEFRKASGSVSAQLDVVKNTFTAASIELGEKFAPTVLNVSKAVAELVNWFSSLDSGTVDFISRATLAATAVAGVTLAIGATTKAVLALRLAFIALKASNPLLLVASGIATLGVAVATYVATAPEEVKKGNDKILEDQKENNRKILEEQKAANKKDIDEIKRLLDEKRRIISGVDDALNARSKEAALKQLEIEKVGFELRNLEEQKAGEERIEIKEDEYEKIAKLEEIAALEEEIRNDKKLAASQKITDQIAVENDKRLDSLEIENKQDEINLLKKEGASRKIIEIAKNELRKIKEVQREGWNNLKIENLLIKELDLEKAQGREELLAELKQELKDIEKIQEQESQNLKAEVAEKKAAGDEKVELKQQEFESLKKIQRLENENIKIAEKENATALDLINREKNKLLLEDTQKSLEETRLAQNRHNFELSSEIINFEINTRALINDSFEKKKDDQKKALEAIDKQLSDITQKGSYPSQEKKLETSLGNKAAATNVFYKSELLKRKQFLEDFEGLGVPTGDGAGGGEEESGGADTDIPTTTGSITSQVSLPGAIKCGEGWSLATIGALRYCVEDCPPGYKRVGVTTCNPITTNSSSSAPAGVPQIRQSTTQPSNATSLGTNSEPTRSEGQNNRVTVELKLKDDLVNFISAKQREQRDLGTSSQ